jgi:hypothetical protein
VGAHRSENGEINGDPSCKNGATKQICSFTSDPRSPAFIRVLTSQGSKAKTSRAMLVKNQQSNLPACHSFAALLFDEIVVDAVSTDRTRDVSIDFGPTVF